MSVTNQPIVETACTFRCPLCDKTFQTMAAFQKHSEYCNDESVAEARSMVGQWVSYGMFKVEFVGKVVGNEGIILIARGYEIRNGTDGEYSSALLKVCRGLPEAFRVIADEKQALSILRRTLTSGLETSWNVWQSAERTGSGQGEAETL